MTEKRQIAVTLWSESHVPVVSRGDAHRQFFSPVVIGLAGSLLLHGLVVQTVVLGSRVHKIHPPEVQEPGSSLSKAAAKPADTLVFVDLPTTAKTTDDLYAALASIRKAIKDTPIAVSHSDPSPPLAIETLALSDDNESTSSVDSGDGADRVRLFGIYSGQIQARVERVWRRPRTPIDDGIGSARAANSVEYFHCQVQIVQDSIGNVQEILLPNCNGSVAWQRSLVLAIQQASPLPAPPSPTVFSHSMTLEFIGYSYTTGSSEDDYEVPPMRTLQTMSTLPAGSPQLSSGVSSGTPLSPLRDSSISEQTSN